MLLVAESAVDGCEEHGSGIRNDRHIVMSWPGPAMAQVKKLQAASLTMNE
jgi:hypothetical protein